jgi:hypothetical protein
LSLSLSLLKNITPRIEHTHKHITRHQLDN